MPKLGLIVVDEEHDSSYKQDTAPRYQARDVAIKRAQIAWAKASGVPTLRTANEVRLEGMLALNRRFGYRTLYDEIVLRGPAAA